MDKSERDRQVVGELNEQAARLYQQGQYQKALGVARQALELAETRLGPDHPDTAPSLTNLGTLLGVMGDLARARPYYERALAICETALGPEHRNTAASLYNLGSLLKAMGDLAGARPHHERALAIREKTLGPKHPDTAASLTNLGTLLQVMGDLAGARPYYERALAILEKVLGPKHPDTAASLNNLGALLHTMGDLAGARPYKERALAICEKVLGSEHRSTASGLSNLGWLLTEMGDLTTAHSYLERALLIHEKAWGPKHPETAQCLHNLGGLLGAMGNLAGARPYYERALAIRETVLGPDHPDTAQSLNNLGVLLHLLGDLAGARPYDERALAINEKVLGPDHPDNAAALNNLGMLCVSLDEETEALSLMRRATAIYDRLLGQVFSIGSDSQRLSFLKTIQGHLAEFLSLVSRSFIDSAEAMRETLDLVLRRKAVAAEALAAQRDAVRGGKYPTLAEPLRKWADLRMQLARKTLAGPGPEGLQAHQRQLSEWTTEKERLETDLARQIPEMNLTKKLQQADRQAVALALDEGVSLVEFVRFDVYDFKAVPARGEPQWQPARYLAFVLPTREPDNVQMIDLGESDLIDDLIADFRSGITGKAENDTVRKLVKRACAPATQESPGSRLRAAVFDKLLPALGEHKRLLLAPDGNLTRLPFEVLPTDDGRLLIDGYQISYLGSGRDVLRFDAKPSGQPTAPLVLADPDFDLQAAGFWSRLFGHRNAAAPTVTRPASAPAAIPEGRSRDVDRSEYHFGRLPGTRAEGERIAALLKVQPWLDTDALEGRLKRECRSPRILHLATHGFFLEDQPHHLDALGRDLGMLLSGDGPGRLSGPLPENPLLRSGLALAGANTWLKHGQPPAEAEDGLLTAEDVSGLDLLDTELVVLSACETGLGQIHTGEGVFGLQRAFILAGAKTLVMSLWAVPDEATRLLMEDFYGRVLGGQPRAEALRQAQQALRAQPQYSEPLYWGAFVCLGNPGPLDQQPART